MATFMKITNEMVYNKLLDIETHILKTNGKVKLNRWIATTSLSLVLAFSIAFISTKL